MAGARRARPRRQSSAPKPGTPTIRARGTTITATAGTPEAARAIANQLTR
jgi:hypothetical protein